MSNNTSIRLVPGGVRSLEMKKRLDKIFEIDRARREEKAKKLRAERQQLYDSTWFDRNYYIPIEAMEAFFTDPGFDIDCYSYESYRKRDSRKKEIANFGYQLYNKWISNYLNNNNQIFYQQVVYLDNYTNRAIIRDVLQEMKNKYGEESFDPFTEEDYQSGIDDYRLYDSNIVDEYEDSFCGDIDNEYDSEP